MAVNEEKLNAFVGKTVRGASRAGSVAARRPLHAGGAVRQRHGGGEPQSGGTLYYGASSLTCVPVSLAQHGLALGAQAGERRLRDVMMREGGFSKFRRATETPFNIVFEVRP